MDSAMDHHAVVYEPDEYGLLSRRDFPKDFSFGVGAAAFQYEGAPDVDGKGTSIWDAYLKRTKPDEAKTWIEAIDHYNRFKEDVKIMKEMGWDSYRFSISWPRILPNGRRYGINIKGVEFYNNLINELCANGIKPMVTLYHWDLPDALEDEYKGFLSKRIVDDFKDFAEICFKEFGDRVKTWVTLNEPYICSIGGYLLGIVAPGRSPELSPAAREAMIGVLSPSVAASKEQIDNAPPPTEGKKDEIYRVAHNQLLAHAAVVKLYRENYQDEQQGIIGITLNVFWHEPYNNTKKHKDAARRSLDFMFGWYMDPITYGKYPDNMTRLLGGRLPSFTEEESVHLKGSFDFLGLNYYTARYSQDVTPSGVHKNKKPTPEFYNPDSQARLRYVRYDGEPIGKKVSDWIYLYPEGILKLLLYTKEIYGNHLIYITENGVSDPTVVTEKSDSNVDIVMLNNLPPADTGRKPDVKWNSLLDTGRISYHYSHLLKVKEAIERGVDVKGYYAWSLHDNLEWGEGFKTRFGLNFIDFNDGLKRYPKLSVAWFKYLLQPVFLPIKSKADEVPNDVI